jgi:glycine C-acetyltransferase
MTSVAAFNQHVQSELDGIRAAGLFKSERIIATPQGALVKLADGRELINLCANNYLGLSSHPTVIEAAHEALRTHGYGMSSVRFICGTQDIHKELEQRLARFLGTEDTILYAAAFDANGGLFEPLLGEDDAIISDALNHASIIDGIRLCKAKRFRYAHNDMADLEAQLKAADAAGARFKLVFTDGAFSMDGTIAQLDKIRALCDQYGALLGVDECHATGFLGARGRGTHEHRGVFGKIDIITGTLGKALGGASGGFTTGKKEVIELLRQRSRPYLFSNTVMPAIVGASLAGARPARSQHRAARQARRQHRVVPQGDHRGRLRDQAGRASDRAHHDRRRRQGAAAVAAHPGAGHLRGRLLLPRRAEGPGAHPRADERGARPPSPGEGRRGLHASRQGTGPDRSAQ